MTASRTAARAGSGAGHQGGPGPAERDLDDGDYGRLLDLRSGLRRFLHWSEVQVTEAGLTPTQHQLLLAIRGSHVGPDGPTIGEIAERLYRRHNTVVGLVDRAVEAGLVERHVDRDDRRIVRLSLTDAGASRLAALAGLHLEELQRLRSLFEAMPPPPDGGEGT